MTIGTARPWAGKAEFPEEALKYALPSFSLVGEDTVLAQHFKRRLKQNQRGIYVDIGCAMPVYGSNTYLFYCHGWRGIGIDLNGGHKAAWAEQRSEDIFVNAAISDRNREVFVFRHSSNDGMLRIGEVDTPPNAEFTLEGKVQAYRLDTVLSRALAPGASVDFFSIDVEGAELGVLMSNDWERFRPSVIMLECVGYELQGPEPPTVLYLRGLGYQVTERVGVNVVLTL
jgi:FkbM family methyltransferase